MRGESLHFGNECEPSARAAFAMYHLQHFSDYVLVAFIKVLYLMYSVG